jgi:hypothetical protein
MLILNEINEINIKNLLFLYILIVCSDIYIYT